MEVLKAIQKAKEVKDRKSSGDKKVRSVPLNHRAGGGIRPAERQFVWLNCVKTCQNIKCSPCIVNVSRITRQRFLFGCPASKKSTV